MIDRELIWVFIFNYNYFLGKIRVILKKKIYFYLYKIYSLEGSWICFKLLLLDWIDEW